VALNRLLTVRFPVRDSFFTGAAETLGQFSIQ